MQTGTLRIAFILINVINKLFMLSSRLHKVKKGL